MTDCADLERRYRRLLAVYPRGFRRENEDGILSVLIAGARPGQRTPQLGEAANLIAHAVWMRVRPRTPHSQPARAYYRHSPARS
jgi:hypothetical protein